MGQTAQYAFDGSGAAPNAERRLVQGTYDFSKVGGGTASYNLIKLNAGCRVLGGWVEVSGTPTAASGTPVLGINVEGTPGTMDLIASTSILGAPWSTAGKKAITPKINTPETTSITLTADRNVQAILGTAALSAGVFTVFLEVIG